MSLKFLTEDTVLVCAHQGVVETQSTQNFVTIAGRSVLVAPDPEGKRIRACPNVGLIIRPCFMTLSSSAGYSTFIRIEGRAVCLETVSGLTDGTPPGAVSYEVRQLGQTLVTGI